jgi:predicted dehydrogenase
MRFAGEYDVPKPFTSVTEMMRVVQPDVVDVATPASARWSIVEHVLEHPPRALLVEKPLGERPSDGYRIVDAAQSAGVALYVNHQLRHLAPLRRFRDLLRRDAIGELRHVRATTRWSLLEHGTHLFDLVDFLVGDDGGPDRVVAQTEGVDIAATRPDAPAYTCGVATYRQGLRVYFECGPPAPAWRGMDSPWHQFGVELVGDRGTAGCSLNRGWWCRSTSVEADETYRHDDEDDFAQGHLLEEIASSISARRPVEQSVRSAAASFGVVMAAQLASLRRTWIDVAHRVDDEEIDELRAIQSGGSPCRS